MTLFIDSAWPFTVAIFGSLLVAAAQGQTIPRVLQYDGRRAIADRLLVGDTEIVVKQTIPVDVPQPLVPETLEEETHRISAYETIVVVTIADVESELVESGTWIRRRIRGQASQLIKAGSLVLPNGRVEFWEDGGVTNIDSVSVSAEPYTRFEPQHKYLLFLRTDSTQGVTYAALAYQVEEDETIRALERTDGISLLSESALVGRRVSDVSAALKK